MNFTSCVVWKNAVHFDFLTDVTKWRHDIQQVTSWHSVHTTRIEWRGSCIRINGFPYRWGGYDGAGVNGRKKRQIYFPAVQNCTIAGGHSLINFSWNFNAKPIKELSEKFSLHCILIYLIVYLRQVFFIDWETIRN